MIPPDQWAMILEQTRNRVDECVRACAVSAHGLLSEIAESCEAAPEAKERLVRDSMAEVLREAATRAVELFTQRTGQAFWWVDDPQDPPDQADLIAELNDSPPVEGAEG